MNSITSTGLQAVKQRLGIVGSSPALLDAIDRALRVAPIDLSVLIIGESGTGKEFFPKIIHSAGARKHARYIAVNCGAMPEGTIDSELFGHEKGAFTGAISSRKDTSRKPMEATIFPRRSGRTSPHHTGPPSPRARIGRIPQSGIKHRTAHQHPRRGRNQRRHGQSRGRRTLPPGPLLQALDRADQRTSAARPRFGHHTARTEIRRRLLRTLLHPRNIAQRRRPHPARILPLARQRAPAQNVVEQLSLFEAGDEITRERLQRYLPAATFSPVVAAAAAPNDPSERSYAREREVLFNMIFRLREEVDSLRAELSEKKRPRPPWLRSHRRQWCRPPQPQPPISHHRA